MLKDKLALFGGTPVRVNQFSSRPFVDEREIEAVSQTIKEGLFSRFVGSNIPGTRDALILTSKEMSYKEIQLDEEYNFPLNEKRFTPYLEEIYYEITKNIRNYDNLDISINSQNIIQQLSN